MEMAGRCLTLASGRGTPFRDVVAAVMEVFDLQVRTGGTTVDGSPDRPANLSIEALASATGWRPETTLIEGLTRYRTFLDETARLAPSRAQAAPSA
jgi:nucleoside-diphosphate-sugar epimerase